MLKADLGRLARLIAAEAELEMTGPGEPALADESQPAN